MTSPQRAAADRSGHWLSGFFFSGFCFSGFFFSGLWLSGLALGAAPLAAQTTKPTSSQPTVSGPAADASVEVDPWVAAIEKANTHRRFAVRRAVANKIARAGASAIPAVRDWVTQNGLNALDLLVVDSIARVGGDSDPVVALLADWADDREFYWRAQALDGLASRALPKMEPRFKAALSDASHIFRIAGARGLIGLGKHDAAVALLTDPDPRTRVRVACALLLAGDDRGLPELLSAIAERRQLEFLGDPWGKRDADLAVKTIEAVATVDFEWRGADEREQTDALARIHIWAAERLGRAPTGIPAPAPAAPAGILGGAEVRSCRNGDLFVRWTKTEILVGLDTVETFPIGDGSILAQIPRDELPNGVRGKVICDFLRVFDGTAEKHSKFAPENLPKGPAVWLNRLAQVAENAVGGASAARALRVRLPQFEMPSGRSDGSDVSDK